MRIISIKKLREFWKEYPDSEQALKTWYHTAKSAQWSSINDIKQDYPSASIILPNRICFNIRGGNYRLIVAVNIEAKILYVRFVGTHPQYDKIDASTI